MDNQEKYNHIQNSLIHSHCILKNNNVCVNCSQNKDWIIFNRLYKCSNEQDCTTTFEQFCSRYCADEHDDNSRIEYDRFLADEALFRAKNAELIK